MRPPRPATSPLASNCTFINHCSRFPQIARFVRVGGMRKITWTRRIAGGCGRRKRRMPVLVWQALVSAMCVRGWRCGDGLGSAVGVDACVFGTGFAARTGMPSSVSWVWAFRYRRWCNACRGGAEPGWAAWAGTGLVVGARAEWNDDSSSGSDVSCPPAKRAMPDASSIVEQGRANRHPQAERMQPARNRHRAPSTLMNSIRRRLGH